MRAPPDLSGAGTPERDWQRSGVLDRVPPLDVDALCRSTSRLVVVAPHPDDEVLGVGGLIALARARGVDVTIIGITDGEASHPGSPTIGAAGLTRRRATERRDALRELGVADGRVERLRLPDGAVGEHVDALTTALRRRVEPGDLLVAPRTDDGHPDHDAAARASAELGGRILRYAVWWWHWASPEDWADQPRARRVDLTPAVRRAKTAALGHFTSQTERRSAHPADAPVLSAGVLARSTRPFEVTWWCP